MPYDQSLDAETFKETKEFEKRALLWGFSYNNGAKKLQLSRENLDQNEQWRFAKLGRLTKEEARRSSLS